MAKRGPIIAIGIVVVLLLVSPFAIGMFVENGLRKQMEVYDEQPTARAEVESYERGYSSSTVRLNFGLDTAELAGLDADPALAAMANFSLPVIVEIRHGPLLLGDGFGLGTTSVKAYIDPESQLSMLAKQFLGIPYIIELRGRSGFGSGFKFEGEIPAFNGALFDMTYDFSGLNFSGLAKGGEVNFDALLEDASLQSTGESVLLERLGLKADWQSRPGRLALSDVEMTLGRVAANNPLTGAAPVFAATDVAFTSSVSESGDGSLMAMAAGYRVGSLNVADELNVSDAEIGMRLSNIDAEGADELYAISGEISGVSDPNVLLDTLMPSLDKIVAKGPALALDPVQFSMQEGSLAATANVSIDPSVLPTGSARDLQNIAFLLAAVKADLELKATKELVQHVAGMLMESQVAMMPGPDGGPQSPEQIAATAEAQAGLTLIALTAQGILIDDGDNYTATLSFADGQPLANGRPLPLFGF